MSSPSNLTFFSKKKYKKTGIYEQLANKLQQRSILTLNYFASLRIIHVGVYLNTCKADHQQELLRSLIIIMGSARDLGFSIRRWAAQQTKGLGI